MNAKDGGPAFPHLGLYPGADGNLHPTPTQHAGMTLRDWFAGQAVLTVMAWAHGAGESDFEKVVNVATRGAYAIADAMLEARKGGAK